jgi:hypothetical protein
MKMAAKSARKFEFELPLGPHSLTKLLHGLRLQFERIPAWSQLFQIIPMSRWILNEKAPAPS